MALFDVPETQAQELFIEMLKWLWLCAYTKQSRSNFTDVVPPRLMIQAGMVVIDEFWHTFIIHTADYRAFCHHYFDGLFVDHSPSAPDFVFPDQAETEGQLSFIYDLLGEETIEKWYVRFAQEYSPEKLSLLQKPYLFGGPA